MKDAEYYINLCRKPHSDEELKKIASELDEWLEKAPEEETEKFVRSGAGEALYMSL